MTEFVQRILLKNSSKFQYIWNEKLAKRKGAVGKIFSWMAIGPRNYGQHIIPRWFRFWNTYMLDYGFRMNWMRPHITKFFTKERDAFMSGYAGFFILWAWFARKNKIRPLYRYEDYHLNHYDNPSRLTQKYRMYVPFNVSNYKTSAHYIEINQIYVQEMWDKLMPIQDSIAEEFEKSTEKGKRTKYVMNPNYVYEPFGWEIDMREKLIAEKEE